MATQARFGPKVILFGESGTGKTHALQTLIPAGITPFVIATEQNFVQVMRPHLGSAAHYKYISPRAEGTSIDAALSMLEQINKLSYENLCKVIDPFKMQHNKYLSVVASCKDFVCDCCQRSWGAADSWGTDRALVIDSLSGLSDMAFALVVGNKPVRAIPDYGVAQNALRMLLDICTTQVRSTFVLVSHIDKEKDELTGGFVVTLKTVGNKLGPDLPRMFSDVIRARKTGATFVWDTADAQSTVVARHIGISQSLPPDFGPLITAWKARGGVIASAT